MKNQFKQWGAVAALATILILTHSNCANRWREASTGRSSAEVGAFLNTIGNSATGSPAEANQIIDMVNNQGATVYYSEAPGEMGPIHAVAPINFSGISGTEYGLNALRDIRIFFIDLLTDDGNQNALVIQYRIQGEDAYTTKIYSNLNNGMPGGYFQDGEFVAQLKDSANNVMIVRSFDVEPDVDQLAPVIQIEFSKVDAGGNELENWGQISSMEGFSGF